MDLTTVFGLVIALLGIVGGQLLEGGQIGSLIQFTAFVIVCGGTLGAVLVQSPLRVFVRAVRMAKDALFLPRFDGAQIVDEISGWASMVRKDGILALDGMIESVPDAFSRSGLQMRVDGFDATSIHGALDVELGTREEALRESAKVWEAAGGYAPTVGILGAVLGLIHVMENLADPAKLGAGIAVAFVATVYGVGLANLVFLPIAGKLRANLRLEVLRWEMIQDGLVGIANGENPRLIASRLNGYLVAR
jgi:chemotaxis protein MotA